MRPAPIAAILVLAATPASAHRLDEYLQGTMISVEKNRLQVEMTLTPGVAVFPFLLSSIDTNADGAISGAEQRAYAAQVLRDLSLTIDGHRLTPQLHSLRFPPIDEMKEGRGEIHLDFDADLPGGVRNRKLVLENHHQSRISVYQVNCLVPADQDIRIESQDRNFTQSHYQLQYAQTDVRSDLAAMASRPGPFAWLGTIALLLFTRLVFLWRHGPRHN